MQLTWALHATFWLVLLGQTCALKNVLMLMMDDYRPEMGSYTDVAPEFYPKIYTPNLDALADRSLVLKQAYCQQPRCNPSRTSLLTARRPEDTMVFDTSSYFREMAGNFTTLPQYFKELGYQSIGMGKVFHYGRGSDFGEPPSWSIPHFQANNPWSGKDISWYAVSPEEREERPLQDDSVKEKALETLHNLAEEADSGEMQPFFLAVGFHKPHLPFIAPEEFFDLYSLDEVELPTYGFVPSDFPEVAWSNSFEIRDYRDIEKLNVSGDYNVTIPDDWSTVLRLAYYASVSYVDSLIGEVVDELENLGLAEDTIIAFWGDHGFLLGEHGMWAKNSIFEMADISPMMVRVPGLTDDGLESRRLTELIDLYPTLVELAGLPQLPLCPDEDPNNVTLCRQGTSFVPLIYDPDRPWKTYAFSMFPRSNQNEMGYSIKSDDGLRYMNWVAYDKVTGIPDWDTRVGEEFYNHTTDPFENVNLAVSTDDWIQAEKRRLRRALTVHGWQGANPEVMYNM